MTINAHEVEYKFIVESLGRIFDGEQRQEQAYKQASYLAGVLLLAEYTKNPVRSDYEPLLYKDTQLLSIVGTLLAPDHTTETSIKVLRNMLVDSILSNVKNYYFDNIINDIERAHEDYLIALGEKADEDRYERHRESQE